LLLDAWSELLEEAEEAKHEGNIARMVRDLEQE
jgi:hypothetical protein